MHDRSSSDINQSDQQTVQNNKPSKLALWSQLDDVSSQSIVGGIFPKTPIQQPNIKAYSGLYHWFY